MEKAKNFISRYYYIVILLVYQIIILINYYYEIYNNIIYRSFGAIMMANDNNNMYLGVTKHSDCTSICVVTCGHRFCGVVIRHPQEELRAECLNTI